MSRKVGGAGTYPPYVEPAAKDCVSSDRIGTQQCCSELAAEGSSTVHIEHKMDTGMLAIDVGIGHAVVFFDANHGNHYNGQFAMAAIDALHPVFVGAPEKFGEFMHEKPADVRIFSMRVHVTWDIKFCRPDGREMPVTFTLRLQKMADVGPNTADVEIGRLKRRVAEPETVVEQMTTEKKQHAALYVCQSTRCKDEFR